MLGLDPDRQATQLRRRIGSQLQSSSLPERLKVEEAITLFSRLHPRSAGVDSILRDWGLEEIRRRAFGALSGGQQQRVFLALALLGQPEVLFLSATYGGPIRMTFTAERCDLRLLRKIPGLTSAWAGDGQVTVVGEAVSAAPVAAVLAEQGLAPVDFRTHYPSLEDVFLSLAGRTLSEGTTS